ncbi:MAG: hypothetical protein K0S65_5358, partial [Labilithrix sp.]|nr:hypothetical protein [Labilithrix sp.]
SNRRFRFDVASFRDDNERTKATVLYPSHAAFFAERRANGLSIPSVQTIATYAKQLDDAIYAGVELEVQYARLGAAPSKRTILTGALEALLTHRGAEEDSAAAHLASALRLGNSTAAIPADLEDDVATLMAQFRSDLARSKPIGFYTWSDDLRAIWVQDRFLQAPLDPGAACALAEAVARDDARKARYETLTALYSRLTNPLRSSLVARLGMDRTACLAEPPAAFLSTSRTAEETLFERLYPAGAPASANLMQDLIDAIRRGDLDLAPRSEDGFYQYQSHALETLLVTDKSEERSKVAFTGRYKKRLQEAFATMLVQHRETHVKQTGEGSATSSPPARDVPDFSVEPLATVYVRHARSYVFLEKALEELYGPEFLDRTPTYDERGARGETVRQTIVRARDLFFNIYLTSAFELGMLPKLDKVGDPVPETWPSRLEAAYEWRRQLTSDPLASADVRVVVPIARIDGTHLRYWAVIGVRTTLASYSFIKGVSLKAPEPDDELRVALPTEQFLEYTASDAPPTRDELRKICDENKTAEAIQAALEKL